MIDVFLDSTKQAGVVELDAKKLTAKLIGGTTTLGSIKANIGVIGTGRYYWEVKINAVTSTALCIGVCSISDLNTSSPPINSRTYLGSGNKNPTNIAYGAGYTTNDVISVLLDLDSGTLGFWKNGINQGVSHNDISSLGQVSPYFIIWYANASHNSAFTANFGATPFQYTVPQGYKAYNNPSVNKILLLSDDGKTKTATSLRISEETIIPKMTSNTAPSGKAFSSSQYSASYAPWYAFNRIDDNEGFITVNGTVIGHLGYEFPMNKVIVKYAIRSTGVASHLNKMPKNWTFEGSNDSTDGTNGVWSVLDTQVNQIWATASTDKEYLIPNQKQFKTYRLKWTANGGFTNSTDINELKMYELISFPIITNIPSQSEQSFVNHGISQSDLASIDMSADFTEKHYIQDVTTVLGSGKVFEQALDTNKVLKSIKIK